MFSSLGLFRSLPCPAKDSCTRSPCIFSHSNDLPAVQPLNIPVELPVSTVSPTVPSKRPVPSLTQPSSPAEPPRKVQKTDRRPKPPTPSASQTTNGIPVLRINPAQSQVPLPVRQAMLKTLFDHFTVLYGKILSAKPSIASEHALKQEEEIYAKSSKLTYRNAVIQSVAALKRRPTPDSVSHPSVGTEGELTARAEVRSSLDNFHLTRNALEPYIHSKEDLVKWGYVIEIPEGPGSDEPSLEGKVAKCERCSQPFMVKRREEAEECVYHWGRLYYTTINGERTRIYNCCSRSMDGDGCTHGPHVFYDSKAEILHSRHAFSYLLPGDQVKSALDVVALDCEMIYTTGGSRIARVSVVDGAGKEVFDQPVKMDEGVEVIDYITRFSGITPEIQSKALLSLDSIRKALDSLLSKETILVGHALENDLKALRIVHHNCVDTSILFPHRAGAPYRRSLKDLYVHLRLHLDQPVDVCKILVRVRENLGITIQAGDGTVGHSSAEDALATLNLIKWYLKDKSKPTSKTKENS